MLYLLRSFDLPCYDFAGNASTLVSSIDPVCSQRLRRFEKVPLSILSGEPVLLFAMGHRVDQDRHHREYCLVVPEVDIVRVSVVYLLLSFSCHS